MLQQTKPASEDGTVPELKIAQLTGTAENVLKAKEVLAKMIESGT